MRKNGTFGPKLQLSYDLSKYPPSQYLLGVLVAVDWLQEPDFLIE